jgi:hypothetical protein
MRLLERTEEPTDKIGRATDADPSVFKPLFKRIRGITAEAYRRKSHQPDFIRTENRKRT